MEVMETEKKTASCSAADKIEVSVETQKKIDEFMKPAVEQSYLVRQIGLSATAQDRGGAWVADPFQSPQWFSGETYSLLDDPKRLPALRELARTVLAVAAAPEGETARNEAG